MKNKKTMILLIVLAILVVIAGGLLIYTIVSNKKAVPVIEDANNSETENSGALVVQQQKNIKIFNGNDRPIAVMIDNHSGAWPQANLNKAYMVYEIVVEGGETRLMVLFKGQNLEKIGPVRSSRHYFLD